jgi:large subunit ribosomal protein L19
MTTAIPSNGSILEKLESQYLRTDLPKFRVGDTVAVHYRIVEGDKTRVQVFKGLVLKRHRAGARSTFSVRKTSFGVGVERTFVLNSPRVEQIEVVARGMVRRARLFYLRDLTGKKARVRARVDNTKAEKAAAKAALENAE